MICPKCGEVNASNFLFCGMCGTILEPARKATAPAPAPTTASPRPAESRPPVSVAASPAPVTPVSPPPSPPKAVASEPVPPIGGPSVLGLNHPNVDVLRERAFSGLESYGEREETKSSAGRILLLLLLLAGLGAAGWWAYNNYLGVAEKRKPTTEVTPSAVATTVRPPDPAVSSQVASSAAVEPENPPAKSTAATNSPVETRLPVVTPAAPETKAKTDPEVETVPKAATPAPTPARHEVSAERLPAPKPAPPAVDNGEALFRKGQSYLYGRGGTEDCTNALKYLRMASDKSHAKARSMLGTMYATGHCVPRDLPSAYRWFALALRVDPNNGILEKDLSGVWSQMTPPERQLATKSQ